MMHLTFQRKGYGRIYVKDAGDIETVKQIIREMDDLEADYIPDDLIAPFPGTGKIQTVGTQKFDALDLQELTAMCWAERIPIFCWIGEARHGEHE